MKIDGFVGPTGYERVCLPHAGGLYDQPARDMEALQVLENTATSVLHEQSQEQREKSKRGKSHSKPPRKPVRMPRRRR